MPLKQNNVGWAKPAPPNGTASGLYFKYPAEYNEVKDNGCRIEGSERYGVRVGTRVYTIQLDGGGAGTEAVPLREVQEAQIGV